MAQTAKQKAATLKQAQALLASSKERLTKLETQQASAKEFIASSGLTPTQNKPEAVVTSGQKLVPGTGVYVGSTLVPARYEGGPASTGTGAIPKTFSQEDIDAAVLKAIEEGKVQGLKEAEDLAKKAAEDAAKAAIENTAKTSFDAFKAAYSVFFSAADMAKPWVDEVYTSITKYQKAGYEADEAFNLTVLEAPKNPLLTDFTKRFKGIYALQTAKQAGEAVIVPTVAEYVKTQDIMGDALRAADLSDLATEDFTGDVIGKKVSATTLATRITNIATAIDTMPADVKDTITRFYPSVNKSMLVRAIALGTKGTEQLQNELKGYSVLAAAENQGLGAFQGTGKAEMAGGVTTERAYQYGLGGETYGTALTKFGAIKEALPEYRKLLEIKGKKAVATGDVLGKLEAATFGKSADEIAEMERIAAEEAARYSSRSGAIGPKALASQTRQMF